MKRILFIAATLAAIAAGAASVPYWVEVDPSDSAVKKKFGNVDHYFERIDLDGDVSSIFDASWWFTPDESQVEGVEVSIKKGSDDGYFTKQPIKISPKDTEADIWKKIDDAKIPSSAAGAYALSVAALAKSLYNEIQNRYLKEGLETIAKTLQADLLADFATTYDIYTTDGGEVMRVISESALPNYSGSASQIDQLKTLRSQFGVKAGNDVKIPKSSLVVQGVVGLSGGGGGSSPSDGMSVTNMTYRGTDENDKVVDKNVLALAGWWQRYSDDGGIGSPDYEGSKFLCDFSLDDLTKPVDDASRENLNKHFLLTRTDDGLMHYIKMDSQLKAAVVADDVSITTNKDFGAVKSGTLSLANWTTPTAYNFSEWLLMSEEQRKSLGVYGRFNADVVIRQRYSEDDYSQTNLMYYSSGSLYEMSWSTNWNEAAKDIAAKEAEKVVNWNTNWVRLADNIASSQSEMKKYVDNSLNWSTNWFASVKDMEGDRKKITDYINGQLDILTNTLNGIDLAVETTQGQIKDVKDYVQKLQDFQTNVIINTELAKVNGSIKSTHDFVSDTYDILTNQIDGIRKVVESEQAQTIQTTKDYVQSVMDFQTNLIINTELAKLNGTIKTTKKLIDETYDILTNELQGIHKAMDDESVDFINSVKDYVDRRFDIETNVIVSVEMAKQNQSIKDVRTFVNDTFELITNRLNGIDNLIKSGDVASIYDVASYIDAQLDIETNIVKATELAQANQSIADIKSFVDDTYTILTNTLAAIENLKKSGEAGISSVKDYVDTKLAIDTNLVSAVKIAEMQGSIDSIRNFVYDTLEVATNLVASINDFVERQRIDGVRTISDYMRWKMNYETNLFEKIAQANKKMGELDAREFATFVTNLYQNTYEVENWEIITNVYITYFGGKMATAGERVEPPKLDPKDDPYSPEFEEDEYSDFLLPVKNARIINEATNAPLNKIRAEHMFDFDVLDTNVVTVGSGDDAHTFPVVQLRGFSLADAETCTKVPVKRSKDKIKPPESTGEAPYSTEFASDYALDWMDFPEALVGITSNGIEKIEKWLKEQNEVNIFNLVASNHVKIAKLKTDPYETIEAGYLLDHKTLWTNDTRKAEIMGYHTAAPYTVPYIDYGEVTNLVDMGELVDNGWYEPVIDPETGEQAIDPETGEPMEEWIENWEWEENWQEVVTTEKFFKWEKLPMSDERLQEKYLSQYGIPWFWSLSGGEVETTIHGVGQHVWNYSSIFGFPTADDCAIPWRHEVDEGDDEDTKGNCIAKVNWTEKPEDASSTKNYELTMNGTRVAWTPSASAIRFVGNVGSGGTFAEAVVGEGANTNTVTFASAADSNVKVDVQGDGNGNVTITIGVYYVTESNLNPSSGNSGL